MVVVGVQSLGGRPELGGFQELGASRAGGSRARGEQPQERGGGGHTVLSVTVEFAYNEALLLVPLLL